jgi:hypothetical protein
LRYERKQRFRIETPAGLSHGRNFFDLDISQISRLSTQGQGLFSENKRAASESLEIDEEAPRWLTAVDPARSAQLAVDIVGIDIASINAPFRESVPQCIRPRLTFCLFRYVAVQCPDQSWSEKNTDEVIATCRPVSGFPSLRDLQFARVLQWDKIGTSMHYSWLFRISSP